MKQLSSFFLLLFSYCTIGICKDIIPYRYLQIKKVIARAMTFYCICDLVLLANVLNLEVGNLALEVTCFLQWEHKCAHVVHLVLAALVVVECLLVECLNELAVNEELCNLRVTADCIVCLLAWEEAVVECHEVAVA